MRFDDMMLLSAVLLTCGFARVPSARAQGDTASITVASAEPRVLASPSEVRGGTPEEPGAPGWRMEHRMRRRN